MTAPLTRQELARTLPGFAAIAIWSTSIAMTRGTVEQFGAIPAATLALLLGGLIGLAYLTFVQRKLAEVLRLPVGYLAGGGMLVTLYLVSLYLALGLTTSRRQVIDVGLINYLWPGLTLVFSVPMLRKRAGPWLLPGLLLAFAGVVVSTFGDTLPTWTDFLQHTRANSLPYLLALVAAVTWALYSNVSRRWAANAPVSAMPLFIFLAGAVMALLQAVRPHTPMHWTLGGMGQIVFVALGPTLLGYLLWDLGVQRGRLTLLASLSNFIPLFSTLVSSVVLGVRLSPYIGLAVLLIIGGAALCDASIEDRN